VHYLEDIPAALKKWHPWISQIGGRLAFNYFKV
jgi:hypothetical protein